MIDNAVEPGHGFSKLGNVPSVPGLSSRFVPPVFVDMEGLRRAYEEGITTDPPGKSKAPPYRTRRERDGAPCGELRLREFADLVICPPVKHFSQIVVVKHLK